jgi:flagellar hook assembly protein FlgD
VSSHENHPYPSYATLEIYNIMGKKAHTLVADQKPAGQFEIQWDGTAEWDQSVASGI